MLDWSRISNDKIFQRLVNHLFALECNSPGFIPSSPYIGADGGWDGYYKGYYPPENKEGLYMIQAKWTKHSGKRAFNHLNKEIKKALLKAKKKDVNYLMIAANAELTPDYIRKLEELNKGDVALLRIWSRENLNIRIEKQPFLRYFFFGAPQHPIFVPWNLYFDKLELHLSSFSAKEFARFKEYIDKVEQFILSDKKHLFIIHAPAGYGKSHLLREIAQSQIVHQIDPTRETWLVRAGFKKMEEAIQEEINIERKYLFIFDDVDRNINDFKPLLALLRAGNIDLKLIVALRSSSIYLFQQKIIESKCSEISEEIKITDWSKDELIKLLRLTAGRDKVDDEELIVNDYPNPYLIVWIGNQLKGKVISEPSVLRKKFIEDIVYDSRKCLEGLIDRNLEDFLFALSCIIPFSFENKVFIEKLSSEFNIDSASLREAIDRLLKAGILRQIGRRVRFNPDMKGDIYLSYRLKDLSKDYLKTFILKWISICPENIFINIGSASKYEETNVVKEILVDFLNERIDASEKTPGSKRKEILNLVEKIISLVPEETISLISSYLETPVARETHLLYQASNMDKIPLTTDDYGPIIDQLIKIPSYRNEVINIIEKITTLDIAGIYDNYKPASLICECVSPLRNNIDDVLSTLESISKWVDEPNPVRIYLLKFALSEVLAGAHEFRRSFLDKFEFGERPLIRHPKVLEMRSKALSILKTMLLHNVLDVQIEGINIAGNIGRTAMGRFPEHDLPLAETFKAERKEITEEIGKQIHPDADFRLLSTIEDLFIGWWVLEKPGTERVVDYLRKFPRAPEYLIFRYFVSKYYFIENFSEIEAKAPHKERWGWFAKEVMSKKWEMKPEDFSEIVRELNKKYNTKTAIINFLIELDKKLSSYQSYSRMLFIIQWVRANPTIFKELQDKRELWEKVPERFKKEIEITLIEVYPQRLNNMAEEILKGEVIPLEKISRAKIFLWLLPDDLSGYSKEWIEGLIEKGNSEIRSELIHKLYFVFKKTNNIELIIDSLLEILSKEKEFNQSLLANIDFLMHHLWKEMDRVGTKKEMLRKKLLEMLKNNPSLSWGAQEILERCIEDIEEVIDFIEHRLNKAKAVKNREEFEAIPFEGIKCLIKNIYSFNDYWKFMQKIIYWYKSDIFWKNFETRYLMESIVMLREKNTNEVYLIKCIQKLLQEKVIEDASICIKFLPLRQDTIDIFIEFSERGIAMGQYEKVKSLLFSKTWPEGVFSSKMGEPPPALVEIKNTFREMMKQASSGRLKNLIKRCIEIVEKEIENRIKQDEEILMQKG